MADERSEAFDSFLDTLLQGGRPSPGAIVEDEGPMARLAAELAAAGDVAAGDPDPAFAEQLRLRMRDADAGIATVQGAPPPAGRLQRIRLTRRDLLRVGLGAAAGLAAGAGAITILRSSAPPPLTGSGRPLVRDGQWVAVATLDDLPEGAAVRFTTIAFDGYVVNDAGTIRALSSVCTHMGCTLTYRPARHDLRCPCHGAIFDLSGHLANGRVGWSSASGHWGDDEPPYPIDLAPLVRPAVKVSGDNVLVWTAKA
jgi:nitrite reductase/ring-hydroxylating ferredoxin subunit